MLILVVLGLLGGMGIQDDMSVCGVCFKGL